MDVHQNDPWQLEQKISEFLFKKQRQGWGKAYSAHLSPSMILNSDTGPRCDRSLAYKLIGAPEFTKFPLRMLKRFDVGTAIHKLYQGYLQEIYGPDVAIEVEGWIPWLSMRCKADAELRKRHGLEIKPVSSRQYDKVISSGKPLDHHFDQVQFYFESHGWDTCTFFYICLDSFNDWYSLVSERSVTATVENAERVELVSVPDPARFDVLAQRILGIITAVNGGDIPPRFKGWWCTNCTYADYCGADTM
jgi:hypothetical protein